MKKIIFAAALLLSMGFAGASAAEFKRSARPIVPVHNILSTQLPPVLLQNIKKEYKEYWITELYQEGNSKQASYFITVENADQVIKLNCDDKENWIVISTTIKV
jgi:hypothetical protein